MDIQKNIYIVGNTMIDTLLCFQNSLKQPVIWDQLSLRRKSYFILTLHRPSYVDKTEKLKSYIEAIIKKPPNIPIIFPTYLRTMKILENSEISSSHFHLINPLSYLEFNYLSPYKNQKV